MAFELDRFGEAGSDRNTRLAPRVFAYRSMTDTIAAIGTAGYFNNMVEDLKVTDIMFLVGSDGKSYYRVSDITGGVVTVVAA